MNKHENQLKSMYVYDRLHCGMTLSRPPKVAIPKYSVCCDQTNAAGSIGGSAPVQHHPIFTIHVCACHQRANAINWYQILLNLIPINSST